MKKYFFETSFSGYFHNTFSTRWRCDLKNEFHRHEARKIGHSIAVSLSFETLYQNSMLHFENTHYCNADQGVEFTKHAVSSTECTFGHIFESCAYKLRLLRALSSRISTLCRSFLPQAISTAVTSKSLQNVQL